MVRWLAIWCFSLTIPPWFCSMWLLLMDTRTRASRNSSSTTLENAPSREITPTFGPGSRQRIPISRRCLKRQDSRPLDYRRWEFEGEVQASTAPEDVTMRPVVGQAALDHRKRFLAAELDQAEPEGRDLIEATFVPKRPSMAQSFVVSMESDPIGYLSVKKDAKTYSMGLSLLPEHWGTELEAKLVAALPTLAARASRATVRLRVDTTAHADASAVMYSELGLQRGLVAPDIWFKTL